jgi:hypothetical protein
MDVASSLRGKGSGNAARLIGSAPNYITDTNFINLLNMYELNASKDTPRKDAMLNSQFGAFSGIPGMKEQVRKWLSS